MSILDRPLGSDRIALSRTTSLHGGRVRATGLAAGLANAGATVAVLCPGTRSATGTSSPSLLGLRALLHGERAARAPPIARRSFARAPFPAAAVLAGPRRRVAAFRDWDVFQFEFCAHARWLDLIPHTSKTVYSAHNVERDSVAEAGQRWLLGRAALARIERLERAAVRNSSLVVTCCREDAIRLTDLYGEPRDLEVVPHGFPPYLLDVDRGVVRARARRQLGFLPSDRVILFMGGDAPHNREAWTSSSGKSSRGSAATRGF